MKDCPDRDCHETQARMYNWIWGEDKRNGANADIKWLKKEMPNKIAFRWPLFMSAIMIIVVPSVIWAWNVSVSLENRVARLETQAQKIEEIRGDVRAVRTMLEKDRRGKAK